MTSHCITWHDTTQAITSHQMTWPSHDLTLQQTSRHQNTSLQSTKHHHHGTAEGSFTAKEWFGHRAGRSPCAHSIGKVFLCYIVLFLLETSAPGLSGHYWYSLQFRNVASVQSTTNGNYPGQSWKKISSIFHGKRQTKMSTRWTGPRIDARNGMMAWLSTPR